LALLFASISACADISAPLLSCNHVAIKVALMRWSL